MVPVLDHSRASVSLSLDKGNAGSWNEIGKGRTPQGAKRSFTVNLHDQTSFRDSLRQRLHERGFVVFDAVTPSVYTTPIDTVGETG